MNSNDAGDSLSDEDINEIIKPVFVVMTAMPQRRGEMLAILQNLRQDWVAEGADWQVEVEFADALLALVQGETPTLPDGNPYQAALQKVLRSIDHYHKGE